MLAQALEAEVPEYGARCPKAVGSLLRDATELLIELEWELASTFPDWIDLPNPST